MGYGYDTYGRLESVTDPEKGSGNDFRFLPPTLRACVRAPAGRRQSFTASLGPDTLSVMGYGYDPSGRLESVTDPGLGTNGFAAVFGYVPDSDLPYTTTSKVGDANGSTVLTGTRGYDAADRLTSIGYVRPGNTVVTSHGYTLDAANRRTRADREDGTAWVYGYNDRDEVTSAVKLLPGEEWLAGWQQSFDYDNLGNRKWTREGGDSAGANRRETVYTPNALNQYTSISHPGAFDVLGRAPSDVSVTVNEQPVTRQGEFWRAELGGLPNALAAVWQPVQVDAVDPGAGPNGADVPARRSGHRFVPMATETPYYDFDGNLVADARWSYVWNGENQLIEVTTAAPALAAGVPRERYRYVYDSRSRRIARTVEAWDLDASAWVVEKNERFVYDDWNVVAVVDATGAVAQRYVWGNDLSGTPQGAGGVGGLIAASDAASGRSWCYAYDGNGNISAVVDLADGAKVGRYDYDAFGRTIATWGDEGLAGVNVYRFSTKLLEGTGLYYYGFRYYFPELGRFISRDPLEESGGWSLISFVQNSSVSEIDFVGLINQNSQIFANKIFNQVSKFSDFYHEIGMAEAIEKIFSGGLPNVDIEDLGPKNLGKYNQGSPDLILNITNPSFNESTFLHEMFHYSNGSLRHGGRDDEGVAYLIQHYYNIGPDWKEMKSILDDLPRKGNACTNIAKKLKVYWPGFWGGTPSADIIEGQYWFGLAPIAISFTCNSRDVKNAESILGARLSCKKLSEYVNKKLGEFCPCIRVTCDASSSARDANEIPANTSLTDFR